MTAPSIAGACLRPIDFPAEVDAVVELILAVNTHDQPGWFPSAPSLVNDWSPTSTFFPDRDLQGLDVDGRLVGLARHSWRERPAVVNHRLELFVHPDMRRQGLGSRLLEWGAARARESAAETLGIEGGKPHQLGGAAPDNVPAANAFAAARGFVPYRHHADMRVSLSEPIRDAQIPDGLEIRPVTPEHHRAIWDADEESFRDHWDHAEPVDGDYERFYGDPDIDTTLWQVAWDGDQVAGLVLNTIYKRENELEGVEMGWVDSVATRRAWRGRGVASALLSRSLHALRERGMDVAALGVDTENPTGALGLYESFGFRRTKTWTFYRKPF